MMAVIGRSGLINQFPSLTNPSLTNTEEDPMATMNAPAKLTSMNAPAKPAQIRLARRSPAYWRVTIDNPPAKLMPHKHPEDRVYTVISGVFYIGLGNEFDASKLEAYPPGAVIILPGNTPHFHWAKSGEYVTQVTAMGPLGLEYLSAKDDPRNM
jgi:quercetin dioxygenase-like cupin family protein